MVEERELPQLESVKYLGVRIDRQLKWHLHVDRVRQLCMAKLALIRRSAAFLPSHVKKVLYSAFVLPHLDYCSTV